MNHTVVVLVGGVHRGVLEGARLRRVAVARTTSSRCRSSPTRRSRSRLERQWEEFGIDVPLEIVYSPYRELTRPILRVRRRARRPVGQRHHHRACIPEFVVRHWWGNLLHNQSALLLKGRLLFRKGTVVTSVPYHLE